MAIPTTITRSFVFWSVLLVTGSWGQSDNSVSSASAGASVFDRPGDVQNPNISVPSSGFSASSAGALAASKDINLGPLGTLSSSASIAASKSISKGTPSIVEFPPVTTTTIPPVVIITTCEPSAPPPQWMSTPAPVFPPQPPMSGWTPRPVSPRFRARQE